MNEQFLLRGILVVGGALLLLKIGLAGVLDLYSDEIFYWWASTMPALAYSDLPFMTAFLVGLGVEIGDALQRIGGATEGGSALAVRGVFLGLGTCIPLLVYWLAKPLVGARQGVEAAGLSLCMPLAGFMGLLAVPDAPLVVFGLLSLGCLERALRRDHWGWWLGAGLAVACGVSTHYRFLPLAGGMLLFLLLYPQTRGCWQRGRFWAALCIGGLGLVPVIWFNLGQQLSGVGFHIVERHPWQFHGEGLLHIFRQAGMVTPPLYALLWFTAWLMWRQGIQGQQQGKQTTGDVWPAGTAKKTATALFLSVAMCGLLPYLVLAPWADIDSTSFHWPLSGYFPLLVFAPLALRWVYHYCAQHWGSRLAVSLCGSVPVVGFCGTLLAIAVVGSQAFQQPLQNVLGTDVLSNKMAGWQDFAAHTRSVIAEEFLPSEPAPLIITDNYYTAAQLEFASIPGPVYTLDQDKAVRDGRDRQLHLWQRDEAALDGFAGSSALFITEDSTLSLTEKPAILSRVCSRSQGLRLAGHLSLYQGDKAFSYYITPALLPSSAATSVATSVVTTEQSIPCPRPDLPQPRTE